MSYDWQTVLLAYVIGGVLLLFRVIHYYHKNPPSTPLSLFVAIFVFVTWPISILNRLWFMLKAIARPSSRPRDRDGQ